MAREEEKSSPQEIHEEVVGLLGESLEETLGREEKEAAEAEKEAAKAKKKKKGEDEEEEEESGEEEEEETNEEDGDDKEDEEDDEEDDEDEEEEEEDPSDAVKTLLAENARLKGELAKPPEKRGKKEEEEEEEIEVKEQDFLTEEEFTEALENKENFNKLLNKVYKEAINASGQYTLRTVPVVAKKEINEQFDIKTLIDDFWAENDDLRPHSDYVTFAMNSLYAEDPSQDYKAIFKKLGPQVRKSLGLKKGKGKAKPKVKANTKTKTGVAKATTGKKRVAPKKPRGIQGEVKDMITI